MHTPPSPQDADAYVRAIRAHYVTLAMAALDQEPDACPEGANATRDVQLVDALAADPVGLALAHIDLVRQVRDLRDRVDGLCSRECV